MGQKMKIDFEKLGMPVFTGRQRAQEVRSKLKLDNVTSADQVDVVIPEGVYAITSSYFLGLFGPSIRDLGLETFQKVFRFQAPDFISEKVNDWCLRAFRDRGDLFERNPH